MRERGKEGRREGGKRKELEGGVGREKKTEKEREKLIGMQVYFHISGLSHSRSFLC